MDTETATIKIIITDDHLIFRSGIKTALKNKPDIEIIAEAENGKQLLDLLKLVTPDIIILNIHMPVMDGYATLPIVRINYPGIKVIILSMNNDPLIIRRMLEMGASTYLTKEAGGAAIYEAIKACHKQWFYINENIIKACNTLSVLKDSNANTPVVFSEKELQLLKMIAIDSTTKEMAEKLDLSYRTVEAIIDKLKTKIDVKSRAELQMFAVKNVQEHPKNN